MIHYTIEKAMCKQNNNRRNIVFVHPDLGIGGAERLVLDVAEALKSGHDISFVTNHFDPSHAFTELRGEEYNVTVIGDWIPRSVLGRFQALCAYVRMVYLILVYLCTSKEQVDLFIVDLIPIAVLFLKWADRKVIYYCHHPDLLASSPGGLCKRIYRKPIDWLELKSTSMADLILVNSQYTLQVFRDTFPTIKKPLEVVYPTIALSLLDTLEQCSPRSMEEFIPEIQKHAEGNIVFLSINRFHPAKRLTLAVDAMETLKNMCQGNEWKRIYLILAGGYDPESSINAKCYCELLKMVTLKGLDDKIILLKSPPDTLKAEMLLSCTCLLYTPVKEHFGIVPLEAMACSKPVIACNSGGPRETVDHGVTGYLCDATPSSMAEFMFRIVNNDVRKMGASGKRRLQQKFSHEHFKKTVQNVVRKMYS